MSLPAPRPLVHKESFSSSNNCIKPRVDVSNRSLKGSRTAKQVVDALRDSQATIFEEDEETFAHITADEASIDAHAATEQQEDVPGERKDEPTQQGNSKEVAKKVNFWGWVDVGFSHSMDEYDRKPLIVDPLTKDGAMEVMEMRMTMKRVSEEMYRWRNEYENNFPTIHGEPPKAEDGRATPQEGVLAPITEAIEAPRLLPVQRPDYVAPRDSLSARFQGMGVRPGSPKSMYPVQSIQQHAGTPQPRVHAPPQSAFAIDRLAHAHLAGEIHPKHWNGGSKQRTYVPQQAQIPKPADARGRHSPQPPRRWAWNDRSSSKSPSPKDAVINQPPRMIQGSSASFGKQGKK